MTKSNQHPPKWIKRFFEWYCSPEIAEDLLGDMDELFYQNLEKFSPSRAKWKYIFQSIALLFSYGVRSRKKNYYKIPDTYHSFAMYRSYSKIAFRSLAKQKIFAVINIVCLSVGMSVGLLALAAWVDVLKVDNFHANESLIYRITTEVDDHSDKRTFASSHAFLSDKLRTEGTGIQQVISLNNTFISEVVISPTVSIPLKQGYYVTPNFLEVFNFPLLSGDRTTAFTKPFSILLSQETAEKLYRDGQALGKIIEIKGMGNFEVTGVVANHPRSHFYFDALTSMATLETLEQQGMVDRSLMSLEPMTSFYTYVLFEKGARHESLNPILHQSASHVQQASKEKVEVNYKLQSLSDIPLSDLNNEIGLSWGYVSLLIFFFLSFLVLLPACFNYANISIARALKRAKEIGLRKVSGGESKHIFFQMVMETIIISVIALGGAMLIFYMVRTQFLQMIVNGHRTFSLEITPFTFLIFLLFAIFTGFAAGALPASYFSKLNPIQTLRNSSATGKLSKVNIRKGLIVVQFALSLVFILSVAIVIKQYRYALNFNHGFQKENILDIQLKGVGDKVFKSEIGKLGDVQTISMSSSIPGNWGASSEYMKLSNGTDSLEVFEIFVDENYIQNLEIKMLAGVSFPEGQLNEEHYIIVNQSFLEKNKIASPHEALGKSFEFGNKSLSIIGVVQDFNFLPLQERIYPFAFRYDPRQFQYANVKIRSNDIQQTLAEIESAWNKLTEQKFEAKFLKHELDDSLVSYRSMVKIFGFLGLLAITISSLGLLAVVISSAESRIREMGIRKVFGATNGNMIATMASGFLKLIGIAIVIATPLTYVMFNNFFLNMYFYRASIGLTELAAGIGFLLVLVAIIIGSQTFRVARINPVETLKYE
jgi:ABC-type antimicrobial peptide transport system permease subunit